MNYELLFSRLDQKLVENNLELDIYCIGGFVLEYHGLKATHDIDAFYKSNETIDRLIKEVGDEFNLNNGSDLWLNNRVEKIMSSGNPNESMELIFRGEALNVYITSLESVLMDKVIASRTKDIPDIAAILLDLNMKNPEKLFEAIEYSDGTTNPAVVFEAYAKAFGEDLLEEYLRDNPNLRRLL